MIPTTPQIISSVIRSSSKLKALAWFILLAVAFYFLVQSCERELQRNDYERPKVVQI